MRSRALIPAAVVSLAVLTIVAGAQTRQRLNPMIDLLEQKKPVFGVYWPQNPQGRRGAPPERPARRGPGARGRQPPRGGRPPAAAGTRPPTVWAKGAEGGRKAASLRNGPMERGVDRALGGVSDVIKPNGAAGALSKT